MQIRHIRIYRLYSHKATTMIARICMMNLSTLQPHESGCYVAGH